MCLVSSRTQPWRREETSLGLGNTYLGSFGFTGIFADFSNGPSLGYRNSERNELRRDSEADVVELLSLQAALPVLAVCGSPSVALSCCACALDVEPLQHAELLLGV